MSDRWMRDSATVAAALKVLDVLLAPLLRASLLPARLLRRVGLHRMPRSRLVCDAVGVLPVADHYYEPLVIPERHLRRPLDEPRPLPGVDLRVDAQLQLLTELAAYADEVSLLGQPAADATTPTALNEFYGPGDAETLYSMIRHARPRRLFEVGSGYSTSIAAAALARNTQDGARAEHVCIEPFENDWLERLPVQVRRERIEAIDVAFFSRLDRGDILFVDASHVIRPQGDVLRVFLELLPILAPGVLVHVHDVFTPRDYPSDWVLARRRLWNEQYLVEALLSGGDRYEVVLALNHLSVEHRPLLATACPVLREFPTAEPGALWLRVVG